MMMNALFVGYARLLVILVTFHWQILVIEILGCSNNPYPTRWGLKSLLNNIMIVLLAGAYGQG